MKKLILAAIIFICTLQILYSQSGWVWQNPLPQGNDLNDIEFVNSQSGFAVGYKGTIIRTTDGGNNWVLFSQGNESDYYNLFFTDQITGYIVGSNSHILKTTNRGFNWLNNQLTGNIKLTGIHFNNSSTGWISGIDNSINRGVIYKTTNAGVNWVLNFTSTNSEILNKVFFVNNNIGWTGSKSILFRTINGGVKWNYVQGSAYANDIYFKDSVNGLIAGVYPDMFLEGMIWKTTDGGYTKSYIYYNYMDSEFKSIDFLDQFTGYAVGKNGKIVKTTNFGSNWVVIPFGYTDFLNSIHFSDIVTGYITGSGGSLFKTSNSGLNWSSKIIGNTKLLLDCEFINQNFGWVDGFNVAMKTTNGGLNWISVWDSTSDMNIRLNFINENTGYLVTRKTYNSLNFYSTSNGGINWVLQSIFYYSSFDSFDILKIQFINSNTGFMVGSRRHEIPSIELWYTGVYFKTKDGGLSWNYTFVSQNSGLYDVQFLSDTIGYIVGDNCKILKTTNTGVNWTPIAGIYNSFIYRKISFVNENTGWFFGSYYVNPVWYPKICKTTDGAQSFLDQFPSGILGLTSIGFYDENTGWATASQGNAYATSNGGVNWFLQITPTTNDLQSVCFESPLTGWVVGSKGTILKTTDGVIFNGVSNISHEIPKSFSLHQNYPNPFNPVTKIKFDISPSPRGERQEVRVIIYDLLGREVATLVNETLKPGTYEVDFDGSSFASGVYFYKLITEEYIETKRMVLIK